MSFPKSDAKVRLFLKLTNIWWTFFHKSSLFPLYSASNRHFRRCQLTISRHFAVFRHKRIQVAIVSETVMRKVHRPYPNSFFRQAEKLLPRRCSILLRRSSTLQRRGSKPPRRGCNLSAMSPRVMLQDATAKYPTCIRLPPRYSICLYRKGCGRIRSLRLHRYLLNDCNANITSQGNLKVKDGISLVSDIVNYYSK